MNKQQLVSFGRGVLKVVGGVLAANGIDSSSTKQLVLGIVTALVGFVFSHFEHAAPKTSGQPTDQGSKTP